MQRTPNRRDLLEAAATFRSAIERVANSLGDFEFRDFPRGSCKASSLIFARFLNARWGLESVLVTGHRGTPSDPSWATHAWLEVNGTIVDLTADQFLDAPGPVVVSSQSEWHLRFNARKRYPASTHEYHQEALARFERQYAAVIAALGAA